RIAMNASARVSLPSRFFSWCKSEWPTIGVIALGIAAQLYLVTRGFEYLLTHVMPDDAFFYFKIAENIVQGLGPTFDGLGATNGFHPLWLVILIPIFKFFASPYPDTQPV